MKCHIHPDIDAIGTCTNCGKTLCSICASETNGKLVCNQCVEKPATQQQAPLFSSPQAGAPLRPVKEPFVAIVLSALGWILFVGLGAVYNGQVKKGIMLSITNWILWFSCYCITVLSLGLCCLVFVVPLAFVAWVTYNSYQTSKKINAGEHVEDWLD